jgi:hypothetical protein
VKWREKGKWTAFWGDPRCIGTAPQARRIWWCILFRNPEVALAESRLCSCKLSPSCLFPAAFVEMRFHYDWISS